MLNFQKLIEYRCVLYFCLNRYSVDEGGTLIIKNLNMEDSGLFQCIATNDAGTDSIVTWLKVKGTVAHFKTILLMSLQHFIVISIS